LIRNQAHVHRTAGPSGAAQGIEQLWSGLALVWFGPGLVCPWSGTKDQVPPRSNAANWYLADELNADLHFVGVRPCRWTSEANWSERQDSNLRLHPSKGCRLATDLLSDGALGGNRIPAFRLRKPNAASGSEGDWSEWLDLNQRSLASEASTFARLSHTPLQLWTCAHDSPDHLPHDGAHDEDRTRLSLLDRELTSPDADVRNSWITWTFDDV
jgi:hypothetical protein